MWVVFVLMKRLLFVFHMCVCVTGISGKSQVLYAIVYTARYVGAYVGDVIYLNAFEIVLRVTLTVCSYVIIYLIYNRFKYESSLKEDPSR